MTHENKVNNFHSGFIALVGRPNVGKSTLLNAILDNKIAIVSNVAQTTRNVIRGIKTTSEYQMVFTDTPGIHKPQDNFGSYLNKIAINMLYDAEIILMLASVNEYIGRTDRFIIKLIQKFSNKPVVLFLNKTDCSNEREIKDKIQAWKSFGLFQHVIAGSALKGQNVIPLINTLAQLLPSGPQYFASEALSDQSDMFYIKEIIREQCLKMVKQEVPHEIAVIVRDFVKKPNIIIIYADIIVNRDSQKGIIIGKQGHNIKEISQNARKYLEAYFKHKIYLETNVKVQKNWRKNSNTIAKLGFNIKGT